MRLLGKIVYTAVATTISVVSGLVRNKIFALYLSLNLFGILAIGQQSASLLFIFFAFGLPLGMSTLSAHIPSMQRTEQVQAVSRMVVLAFIAGIGLLVVVAVSWLIAPEVIADAVTGRADLSLALGILLMSAPFMLIQNCLYSILEGMGKAREIVLFKIIPALVILPLLYVLVAEYHFVGASLGIVLSEVLLVGLGLVLLRDMFRLDKTSFSISPVFRQVFKVAILSFVGGMSWFAVDFAVKRYLLEAVGERSNGIVQSVARIVDLYPNVALSWLTMHLFPTVAQAEGNSLTIIRVIQRTMVVAFALIFPVIIILYLFRSETLHIVYTQEFTVGVEYFGAMLALGLLKVYSWVIGLPLLPLGFKRDWFKSVLLLSVVYGLVALPILWMSRSIYAIPIAFGTGMIIQSAFTLSIYKRRGLVFESVFLEYTLVMALLTVLLVASMFWVQALAGALALYGWFVYKHNLVQELWARIREFRS